MDLLLLWYGEANNPGDDSPWQDSLLPTVTKRKGHTCHSGPQETAAGRGAGERGHCIGSKE